MSCLNKELLARVISYCSHIDCAINSKTERFKLILLVDILGIIRARITTNCSCKSVYSPRFVSLRVDISQQRRYCVTWYVKTSHHKRMPHRSIARRGCCSFNYRMNSFPCFTNDFLTEVFASSS